LDIEPPRIDAIAHRRAYRSNVNLVIPSALGELLTISWRSHEAAGREV
jgi:hypothetical protein